MNYISQINAFEDWSINNGPSTAQYAMYYALLAINNKCGWKEWFTVPYSLIEVRTGISTAGITKTRKALKEFGLIDFISKGGSKAASYRIIPFNTQIVATNLPTKLAAIGTNTEIVATNGSSEYQQMDHIPKQETKTETKNNSVPKSFSLFQNEIGIVSSTISQQLQDDVETYGDETVCDAIREAVKNNVRKYVYVQKILNTWHTSGRGTSKIAQSGGAARSLPTPEEVKLQEEQTKRERQEALRREMFGTDVI